MSFDNPSRMASPWTTLKRTVKTKSLRLVRFASPFQPDIASQGLSRMSLVIGQAKVRHRPYLPAVL